MKVVLFLLLLTPLLNLEEELFYGGCCFSFIDGEDQKIQCRNTDNEKSCFGQPYLGDIEEIKNELDDKLDVLDLVEQLDVQRLYDKRASLVHQNSFFFVKNSDLHEIKSNQCVLGMKQCYYDQLLYLREQITKGNVKRVDKMSKEAKKAMEESIETLDNFMD